MPGKLVDLLCLMGANMRLVRLAALYYSFLDWLYKHDQRKNVINIIIDRMEDMNQEELRVMFHCALRIEDHRLLMTCVPLEKTNED